MSENAIDSENISKPVPDPAKPKGARKPTKKAKPHIHEPPEHFFGNPN